MPICCIAGPFGLLPYLFRLPVRYRRDVMQKPLTFSAITEQYGKAFTAQHLEPLRTLWGSMLKESTYADAYFYADAETVAQDLAERFETTADRIALLLASTSHATSPRRNLALTLAYLRDGMQGLRAAGAMGSVHVPAVESSELYLESLAGYSGCILPDWQDWGIAGLAEAILPDIERLPGHGPKTAAFALAIAGADVLVVDRWTMLHTCAYKRPASKGNEPYKDAFREWARDAMGSIKMAQAALWAVERRKSARSVHIGTYGPL